jgi:hypothetical protein
LIHKASIHNSLRSFFLPLIHLQVMERASNPWTPPDVLPSSFSVDTVVERAGNPWAPPDVTPSSLPVDTVVEHSSNPWAPPDVALFSLPVDTLTPSPPDAALQNARLRIEIDTLKNLLDATKQESNCLKRKLDRECHKRILAVTNDGQRDINTAEQKSRSAKRQLHLAQEETRECVRVMGKYIENMRKTRRLNAQYK